MTKIYTCPNCDREGTMLIENGNRAVCQSCGWRGWEANTKMVEIPDPEPPKRKKGERVHTCYVDDDGNTVVSEEW